MIRDAIILHNTSYILDVEIRDIQIRDTEIRDTQHNILKITRHVD